MAGEAAPQLNFEGIPDAKSGGGASASAAGNGLNFEGIPDAAPAKSAKPKKSWRQQTNEQNEAAMRDAGGAVVRGAVSTVQGLAKPIRKAFGMPPATPPRAETTTVGKTARTMEQVGEFAVPSAVSNAAVKGTGLVKTGVKAATTAAGTYGVARAQGSSPKGAGIAAATGAAGEGLAAIPTAKIVAKLKTVAGKQLATFFGSAPTDAPAVRKAISAIVPTALDEGIPLSWRSWLRQTEAAKLAKGAKVASTVAGPAGDVWAPVRPVIDALKDLEESAKVHLHINTAARTPNDAALAEPTITRQVAAHRAESQAAVRGTATDVPQNAAAQRIEAERRLGGEGFTGAVKDPDLLRQTGFFRKQMEKLEVAGSQGHVPARALHDVKQTWNAFSKFDPSKFTEAKDLILAAKVRAARTATDSIRDVLAAESPDITKVDQAYHLAHGVHEAVIEAALNAQGRAGTKIATGIMSLLRRSTLPGAASGAALGGSANYQRTHSMMGAVEGAVVGGVTGSILERALQSPAWKTKGPQFYNAVAEAIANGRATQLRQLVIPLISAGAVRAGKSTTAAQPAPASSAPSPE